MYISRTSNSNVLRLATGDILSARLDEEGFFFTLRDQNPCNPHMYTVALSPQETKRLLQNWLFFGISERAFGNLKPLMRVFAVADSKEEALEALVSCLSKQDLERMRQLIEQRLAGQ